VLGAVVQGDDELTAGSHPACVRLPQPGDRRAAWGLGVGPTA
jgi:hypothetical protein